MANQAPTLGISADQLGAKLVGRWPSGAPMEQVPALPAGVDPSPLPFSRDAPAWTEDPATLGYIRTCQGTKAGDPINPMYLDRIAAAAQVAEATEAYDAGASGTRRTYQAYSALRTKSARTAGRYRS